MVDFGFIYLYMVVYEDGSVRVNGVRGKDTDMCISIVEFGACRAVGYVRLSRTGQPDGSRQVGWYRRRWWNR